LKPSAPSAFWSGGGVWGGKPHETCRQQRSSGADFRVTLAKAALETFNLISFPVAAPDTQRENN